MELSYHRQETIKKLVKVKFSGMKPISTFYSEMEVGRKFCLAFLSCHPFMQFSEAEIYLLSAAAQLSLPSSILCRLPIHQKSVVHFNSNAVLKVL